MGVFRRSPHPARPLLLEGPCWQVEPAPDLGVVFANLLRLVPQGGVLCLAGGAWSAEGRAFVRAHALPGEGPDPLPSAFDGAPRFPLDAARSALLAELATRHAEPELAVHLGVHAGGVSVLEWFDVPEDPLCLARAVPEERVAAFAEACGARYRAR